MASSRLTDLRQLRQLLTLPSFGRHSRSGIEPVAPVFDLLRERRLEIGQQPIAPVLPERQGLMLQGLSIGGLGLGVVLGITGLVALRHEVVKAQMGQLNEVEAQAQALRQDIAQRNKRLATITQVNQQLSGALSGVRPTSALMSELQLRTPAGVQLLSADSSDNNLVVKGMALDPLAFARINAMQLELRRSPLLDPQSISLSRLERKEQANAEAAGRSSGPIPVQFEISARLAQLPAAQMRQVLQQLGSSGMARRLDLMQKEGLLQ